MRRCDVVDIGVVATPVLYFAPVPLDADGAVIITGSHNPAPDNGFKIMRGRATIHGDEIQRLREAIERRPSARSAGRRRAASRSATPITPYLEHAHEPR